MRGHIRRRLAKPNRQAAVSTRCRGLRSCQSGLSGGSRPIPYRGNRFYGGVRSRRQQFAPPVLIPRFARDSLLEGAVRCELVSAAGSDSAPYEFLESIKKEGPQPSDALPPFSCNQN